MSKVIGHKTKWLRFLAYPVYGRQPCLTDKSSQKARLFCSTQSTKYFCFNCASTSSQHLKWDNGCIQEKQASQTHCQSSKHGVV